MSYSPTEVQADELTRLTWVEIRDLGMLIKVVNIRSSQNSFIVKPQKSIMITE